MLITRKTALSAHIVQFCRFLREQGYMIGPTEEADALAALTCVPLEKPEHLRIALQAALARNFQQLARFKDLYRQYWTELAKAEDSKIVEGDPELKEKSGSDRPDRKPPSIQALKSWLYGNKSSEEEELASYSPGSAGSERDFSAFARGELSEVLRIVRLVARRLALRHSRLYTSARRPGTFAFRRTVRACLRRGGEIAEIKFREPKPQKTRLVLLCDVSKSMDLYSRFLLQFMYGFQRVFQRVEAFVFSTHLERITPHLKQTKFQKALDELGKQSTAWSSGTRIGGSLDTFLRGYASRFLDKRTIVIILSDGWDVGDTELLADCMDKIRRKSHRVIWLNPLAGNPNYEPTVKGMQAALPYIDVFAPVHNLESLRRLVGYLKKGNRFTG